MKAGGAATLPPIHGRPAGRARCGHPPRLTPRPCLGPNALLFSLVSTLKRPEVIVLLIAFLSIALWVLLRPSGDSDDVDGQSASSSPGSETTSTAPESDVPRILDRSLERDYGNARLELRIDLTNQTAEPQQLIPPFVRLTGPDGETIPPFFLALSKPPTLAPGKSDTVKLAYWLEKSHLEGPLWFACGDHTVEVKDDAPLDLESIENQASKAFSSTRWAE